MSWYRLERSTRLEQARQLIERVLMGASFGESLPLEVTAAHLPGEPVPVADALGLSYERFAVGDRWGGRWGTTWFRMRGIVPVSWSGQQVVARVELGPATTVGFGTEGMVWFGEVPAQGLSPNHTVIPLFKEAQGGEPVEFLVEGAANPVADGSLLRADFTRSASSVLSRAELAVHRPEVAGLVMDFETVLGLSSCLPEDSPRAQQLLRILSAASAVVDPDDVAGSAPAAAEVLREALAQPAHPSAHRVVAAGHAHIDTAWLWPLRETVRKCARSFSTALALMEEYPDYVFVCSQAAQHEWVKQHYPKLFERMRKKAADGQFQPVGSMWVEADCNIPSGESLVRQIVYGKRFFLDEYGIETKDVWLPDVFGYSAALPQIMRLAGIEWFMTQKISWSRSNRFPHHTFRWEGIDGTQIFTHFPPADTYNGDGTPGQLHYAESNFGDHGYSGISLYPFGFGDGGGGPTREQIELLRRAADLDGLPKVEFGGPASFFEQAAAGARDLPVWVGELYLELHRGTYTSQGRVKRGNRLGQRALREAELWSSFRCEVADTWDRYPSAELERGWKKLLLNQFHDIVPGSSINWVYSDAARDHEQVISAAERLTVSATEAIAARVDSSGVDEPVVVFNALGHPRREVIDILGRPQLVSVPAAGYAVVSGRTADGGEAGGVRVGPGYLENEHLRVSWNDSGLLTSVYDKGADREVLQPGNFGNLLQLHDDRPIAWDAWDVDHFYRDRFRELHELTSVDVVESSPLRARVRFVREFGGSGTSRFEQVMVLRAGSRRLDFETVVDWHERHKLLKVAFPVDVHSPRATYEIQYGHVERPTHTNTSWDWARFEVCAQTWADLSEPDYGVALLNDCKHGYDIVGNIMRLSLLRAPTSPDPEADQGRHEFTYALLPHLGDLRTGGVVQSAHELNLPLRAVPIAGHGSGELPPSVSLVSCDRPGVVLEVVKKADRADAYLVRVYEAFGQRQRAVLRFRRPITSATETDLLERATGAVPATGSEVALEFRPFQIRTLQVRLGS